MRVTAESTEVFTEVDGVEVRVWNARTDAGAPLQLLVHRVASVVGSAAEAELAATLLDAPEPAAGDVVGAVLALAGGIARRPPAPEHATTAGTGEARLLRDLAAWLRAERLAFPRLAELDALADHLAAEAAASAAGAGSGDMRPGAIRVRLDAARAMVSALCKPQGAPGAREWVMSIPARHDYDPDLVIAAALDDAHDVLGAYVNAQARIVELTAAIRAIAADDATPTTDAVVDAALLAAADEAPADPVRLERVRERVLAAINAPVLDANQAEHSSPAWRWLNDLVGEGRGLVAFGYTEAGNVGLFYPADADGNLGTGDTVEEAVLAAMRDGTPQADLAQVHELTAGSDLAERAAIVALRWIARTPDARPMAEVRQYAVGAVMAATGNDPSLAAWVETSENGLRLVTPEQLPPAPVHSDTGRVAALRDALDRVGEVFDDPDAPSLAELPVDAPGELGLIARAYGKLQDRWLDAAEVAHG